MKMQMNHLLAYCGLLCATCPIYLATLEPEEVLQGKMRESIAEECRSVYGLNLLAADIGDCDGCRADGARIFKGCLDCEIRKCARVRQLETCAFCNDYACNKLLTHFSGDPESQNRLEEIRRSASN